MKDLDVFIHGETINLCIPTEEFARESKWYSWFNTKSITRFLEQGMFPNTPEDQSEFFRSQKSDRFMLIISNKEEYMGIISLSRMNQAKKMCDIAMVVDTSVDKKMSRFVSLESMARVTEHAFNVIGINRVEAWQHVELTDWQQRLELIGYRLEGLHINKFVKGREVANSVSIACLYEDYLEICRRRGCLWDSAEKMESRFNRLPEPRFSDMMKMLFEKEREDYYRQIFLL